MLNFCELHINLIFKRKMLKPTLTFLAGIFIFLSDYSMELPLYSQYMMNGFIFNSAMAGYDGFTSFNMITRQQWLGMQNAPRTVSISFQTRMLKRSYIIKSRPLRENKFIPARSGRVGIGINLFNDRNGFFSQSGIIMSYAYHIPFPNSQLSLGVSGSLTQFKIDRSGISFRDEDDPNLINSLGKPFYAPDANAGVFYMNRELYFGASIEHLMESSIKFGTAVRDAYKMKRHYYFLGGYKFTPRVYLSYEPSFLIKTSEQLQPPQIDLSIKAVYYDNYWFGFSLRTVVTQVSGSTIIFFTGIKRNFFYAGYAFDYGINTYQRNTFGSHELLISLKFGDSARRYKWLNRY
jgi:type IX secretion system PorP/SprF family membrane protein